MMRYLLPILLVACGDTGGCGGSAYPYPRTDPEAAPMLRAMRARVTQTGFEAMARATPGLVESGCVGNPPDATEACAMDPIYPTRIRFYLGTVGSPMTFNVTGLGPGGMRTGSYYSLWNETLRGNMRVDLVQDGGPGALRVIVGCPDLNNCAPTRHVKASIDGVMYFDNLFFTGRSACFIQDDNPPVPGINIRQFQFTLKPHIDRDADGRPVLVINRDDIDIESAEMDLDVQIGRAAGDPYCPQAGDCDGSCGTLNGSLSILEAMFETGIIAEYLAQQIAAAAVSQFADSTLEASGALDMSALIPAGARYANPTGYLIGANDDSPQVSGASGSLGQNYDFDAGFAATRSPCARTINSLSWALPALPDPGAMVYAPDPVTGEMAWEPFDLALIVGDVVLGRAAYELYDGGGLCLDLGADELGELSGGAFVPTVAVFDLLAPGMSSLAPTSAPVDLRVMPQLPPLVRYGTGAVVDEVKDSHIQVIWPEVWVEMYPLVDNSHLNAITFQFTLDVGISLEAAPGGNLLLTIDHLDVRDLGEVFNEMHLTFDAEGVGQLVSVFLPSLVSSEPIDIGLTAADLGLPFVPKFRGVETFDQNPLDARDDPRRFLAMLMRFCVDEDLDDETNALCYDPTGGGRAVASRHLSLEWMGGDSFAAFSDLEGAGPLELAFRIDDVGPWFSFRAPAADGLYHLEHPLLSVSGPHVVSAMARRRGDPYVWSAPASVRIEVDHIAPRLQAWRDGGGIVIYARDDRTVEERLLVRAVVGDHELAWAPRTFIDAPRDAAVTLWAMDEAGLVSSPLRLEPDVHASTTCATPESRERGCAAGGGASWLVVLAILLGRRRS
jgi:hypothetical protein